MPTPKKQSRQDQPNLLKKAMDQEASTPTKGLLNHKAGSPSPPTTTLKDRAEFKSTDCFLAMGRRGCGKSTLAKNLQKAYPRRVIIDSLFEYDEGDVVYDFDEYCAKLVELSKKRAKEFVVVLRVPHDDPSASEIVNHAIRIAFEYGNLMIVVEEVQLFSSHHTLPSYLKNALLIGRHHNIALFFTSQRAGEVHKTIISQCNHIFIGQMHEKNDITYIKSFLGDSVDQLPNYPVHEFLYFSQSGQISRVKNSLD